MNRYKPYEHLKHKSYDKKYDYKSLRDAYYETCQDCERPTYKKTETVHWVLDDVGDVVDANGVEKAILLIATMLYSIDKDEVYDELFKRSCRILPI